MGGKAKDAEIVPGIMGETPNELLAGGSALVRLENHTQMQIAVQRPRDEAKILKAALAELETYPSAAEEAVYHKPVGRADECPKCKAKTWYKETCERCGAEVPMKYAEGLSIRAAENLACRWSNSAWAAEILADDGEIVNGVAIFLDYENNTRRAVPFRVSRKYKTKRGEVKTMAEDRFNDLKVRAETSKALREVITRSLPAGLKKEYENKAREVFEKNAKRPEIAKRVIRGFAKFGVSDEMIERLLGKRLDALAAEDLVRLKGVYNALDEGDITVEAAFGTGGPAQDQEKPEDRAASLRERLAPAPPAPDLEPTPEVVEREIIEPEEPPFEADEKPETVAEHDDARQEALFNLHTGLVDLGASEADQDTLVWVKTGKTAMSQLTRAEAVSLFQGLGEYGDRPGEKAGGGLGRLKAMLRAEKGKKNREQGGLFK